PRSAIRGQELRTALGTAPTSGHDPPAMMSAAEPESDSPPTGDSGRPSRAHEGVALGILLAYGAPSFAGAAMLVPILIHMPKFYADVVLVPLGYLAIAIAIGPAHDALRPPLFG